MQALFVVGVIAVYFGLLLVVARFTSRRADNNVFFRGNRRSPWPLVAFGMIGASISGVSFVSVPGMVRESGMTYLQMCLGFIPGYFVVAYVLLPLYYRLGLTSIYAYLDGRFGRAAYKTGAWFFLLSKMTRASASLFLVCSIVHGFVLAPLGVPFVVTVVAMLALVWLYTRRGGIGTLVWTDTLQTFCLLASLCFIICLVAGRMHLGAGGVVQLVGSSPMGRIFVMDDWHSAQYFWKQFLSGLFIVVVMTGLDQDMMQKNLTCRTLREAQKDMCSYAWAFVPVNLLLLVLGVLLYAYCAELPVHPAGDALLPTLALGGYLGPAVTVLFTLGLVAAAFSSTDSALTALTTSFCIDILGLERRHMAPRRAARVRHGAFLGVTLVFVAFVLMFNAGRQSSLINTIYVLASYTYGPLLGLFAYGLFMHGRPRDRWVPLVAVCAPALCYGLSILVPRLTGYHFGYELLLLNGALTFIGLALLAMGSGRSMKRAE